MSSGGFKKDTKSEMIIYILTYPKVLDLRDPKYKWNVTLNKLIPLYPL